MKLDNMLAHIDAKAGAVRGCYITIAPGQEATYIMKATQARAFSMAGFVGIIPGLIQAEMSATNQGAEVVVARILGEEAQWAKLAGAIENIRRSAKQSLLSSTLDEAAKDEVYDQAIRQLTALMPK